MADYHKNLSFPNDYIPVLFGELNKNLFAIEKETGTSLNSRGNTINISGSKFSVDLVSVLLNQLYELISSGYQLYLSDIIFGIRVLETSPNAELKKIFLDKIYITAQNKTIAPKTQNQKNYIDAIRNNDIVFGIGPAGTGKTYLAVALAVAALTNGTVRSIILTRPAVEAGEKLGFLPGDLSQKIDPYLRPLNDALVEMLGAEKCIDFIEKGKIEIAPLAFMRGRTLSDSFIILDEAQNTTREQMKMFLTRIGFDSQAVITGDITQIDLPPNLKSGLKDAKSILSAVKDIHFCNFSKHDVVRHPLVQRIIDAYQVNENDY